MIPLRLLEIFAFAEERAITEKKNSLMKCIWTLGKIIDNGEQASVQYLYKLTGLPEAQD